jgi:protein arginine kinase activator
MTEIKCLKCQKRAASVKLVRIVGGKAHNIYLCGECAAEVSPYQKGALSLQQAIEKMLAELVQKQSEEQESAEQMPGPVCPTCGTTFAAYRKRFLLGCPHCYMAFESMLDPQLKQLHGATRHVGRAPSVAARPQGNLETSLAVLKKELDAAVSNEDFEQAVKLRDRIRQLESGADHVVPKM